MEKMMPESGPFEAIVTACFSYMDCCFDSFIYFAHTNGMVGISFPVSTTNSLQQTVCKTLMQMLGKQTTVFIENHSMDITIRGINYSLQKNSNHFSSFEIKVENTPEFIAALDTAKQK